MMPGQTKKGDDTWEKKDCKTVLMTLGFVATAPCHDPNVPLDLTLANVGGSKGPFTIEFGTGALPLGITLVMVGSAVRIQGNYNEPIASVLGNQFFRVNDPDDCCVCGNFTWSDNVDGGCPAPAFKRLVFGGTSTSCLGAEFAALVD